MSARMSAVASASCSQLAAAIVLLPRRSPLRVSRRTRHDPSCVTSARATMTSFGGEPWTSCSTAAMTAFAARAGSDRRSRRARRGEAHRRRRPASRGRRPPLRRTPARAVAELSPPRARAQGHGVREAVLVALAGLHRGAAGAAGVLGAGDAAHRGAASSAAVARAGHARRAHVARARRRRRRAPLRRALADRVAGRAEDAEHGGLVDLGPDGVRGAEAGLAELRARARGAVGAGRAGVAAAAAGGAGRRAAGRGAAGRGAAGRGAGAAR